MDEKNINKNEDVTSNEETTSDAAVETTGDVVNDAPVEAATEAAEPVEAPVTEAPEAPASEEPEEGRVTPPAAVYTPVSEVREYSRWSYSAQNEHDRKIAKKSSGRGALVFSIIMSAAFAVAITLLIVSLVFGESLYNVNNIVYRDRVVYVREDGTVGGRLSVPEIYQQTIDSIVTVEVKTATGSGSGSGIVMTADGYVITNNHVIDGATRITVVMFDGTEYGATLCGCDPVSDLAVVKVTPKGELKPAKFGSSDDLVVGENVVAIGSPAGYAGTTTVGIVSATNRVVKIYDDEGKLEKAMTLIQTNANINPGNSGGPLFNMDGEVIGINTLKLAQSESGIVYDGIGFAIPMSTAMPIIEQLKEGKGVTGGNVASKTPSLGVKGYILEKGDTNPVTNKPAEYDGFYVSEVVAGSSAEGTISVGDTIYSVDGRKVTAIEVVQDVLMKKTVGDTITLEYYRNGEKMAAVITLK